MRARVLGSAAGGGFPQWNCACFNCASVRAGEVGLEARTQDSLAVSADGRRWLVLNASPDIRAQIEAFPDLWPRSSRDTKIAAVALTNGDLDHVLGLFSLREGQRLRVFATQSVRRGLLQHNAMTRTLQRFEGHCEWVDLDIGRPLSLTDAVGEPLGLELQTIPAPGKLPLHLIGVAEPSELDNVGFLIRDERLGSTLAYFPGVAGPSHGVADALKRAQVCLFDGTFWSSTELIDQGLGAQRAEDMAHWPLSGEAGSIRWLSDHGSERCFFTHVNNTNPVLRLDSPEHAELAATRVRLAWDGQELTW